VPPAECLPTGAELFEDHERHRRAPGNRRSATTLSSDGHGAVNDLGSVAFPTQVRPSRAAREESPQT
jgi:hypothetical protein